MRLIEGGKKDRSPLALMLGALVILTYLAAAFFVAGFSLWYGLLAATEAFK